MTSSITSTTDASNGAETTAKTEPKCPRDGLPALQDRLAHGLISLGLDALREASNLAHEMHSVIYDKNTSTDSYPELAKQLTEALTCLEIAEHYLFMLGSVFEEHPNRTRPLVAVLNK
jgi:hypothetical protein